MGSPGEEFVEEPLSVIIDHSEPVNEDASSSVFDQETHDINNYPEMTGEDEEVVQEIVVAKESPVSEPDFTTDDAQTKHLEDLEDDAILDESLVSDAKTTDESEIELDETLVSEVPD